MTKQEIREQVRLLKRQHTPEQLRRMSQTIIDRLLSHPRVRQAHALLLYHSLPDEVYTHEAVRQLFSEGKQVFLPAINDKGEMEIRAYQGEESLQTGDFNILQPSSLTPHPASLPSLAVIPGVAFDRRGNRLGRGKGYYDRFLSTNNSIYTIGICFPFQFMENIPAEPHDIPVNEVIKS